MEATWGETAASHSVADDSSARPSQLGDDSSSHTSQSGTDITARSGQSVDDSSARPSQSEASAVVKSSNEGRDVMQIDTDAMNRASKQAVVSAGFSVKGLGFRV